MGVSSTSLQAVQTISPPRRSCVTFSTNYLKIVENCDSHRIVCLDITFLRDDAASAIQASEEEKKKAIGKGQTETMIEPTPGWRNG